MSCSRLTKITRRSHFKSSLSDGCPQCPQPFPRAKRSLWETHVPGFELPGHSCCGVKVILGLRGKLAAVFRDLQDATALGLEEYGDSESQRAFQGQNTWALTPQALERQNESGGRDSPRERCHRHRRQLLRCEHTLTLVYVLS